MAELARTLALHPVGVVSLRQLEANYKISLNMNHIRAIIRGCGEYRREYNGSASYAVGVPAFIVTDYDTFITQLVRTLYPEVAEEALTLFTLNLAEGP